MATTTTRQEKGQELYRAGKVEFTDGNLRGCCAFEVAGSGGRVYEVCFDPKYGVVECECEDYVRRGGKACKHIFAAGLERERLLTERRERERASERESEMALF